ncbi:hypothetical protein SUGI_0038710 [Cryptomeria japonica]|nr:hypothetical protein SUGI_0038710 [Cryptomeria japonica]
MAHFGDISCVNCDNGLDLQLRNLFITEDVVYDAMRGMTDISLSLDRHWCDAFIYGVVLPPLVDIIESGERSVELLNGFVKPYVGDYVTNTILSLEESSRVSILRVYFQAEIYLSDASDEDMEDSDSDGSGDLVDSDYIREKARREVKREERETLMTFFDEAWEVFRCAVFNGNLLPSRG